MRSVCTFAKPAAELVLLSYRSAGRAGGQIRPGQAWAGPGGGGFGRYDFRGALEYGRTVNVGAEESAGSLLDTALNRSLP
jgi:hypothetical protein